MALCFFSSAPFLIVLVTNYIQSPKLNYLQRQTIWSPKVFPFQLLDLGDVWGIINITFSHFFSDLFPLFPSPSLTLFSPSHFLFFSSLLHHLLFSSPLLFFFYYVNLHATRVLGGLIKARLGARFGQSKSQGLGLCHPPSTSRLLLFQTCEVGVLLVVFLSFLESIMYSLDMYFVYLSYVSLSMIE